MVAVARDITTTFSIETVPYNVASAQDNKKKKRQDKTLRHAVLQIMGPCLYVVIRVGLEGFQETKV